MTETWRIWFLRQARAMRCSSRAGFQGRLNWLGGGGDNDLLYDGRPGHDARHFDLDRLRKRGVEHEFPYFATYYLAFDQRKAPWSDRRARLAVAQAINPR